MADVRSDVAAFSRRVLGIDLWPHQIEAAKLPAFVNVIAKARRTGGTVLAETLATQTGFANAGCRVLILSATQDAARRLTESIGQRLARSTLTRGAVTDAHATRIRLTTGSEIISLPASQKQIRGYGEGVLLVILDEAGFMPSELWRAAHYCALDERANGSRVLMLGTPWGGTEHFFRQAFEAGQDGDPDHASFHWRAEVNPKLDAAYLERQRDRVSPAEYAAEVLGEWSDATGALIPREVIDRNTADIEAPGLGRVRPPARLLLGVDWGVSFDRSAAVALARLPVAKLNPGRPHLPVFGVVAVEIWPAGTPLTEVVGDVVSSPGRFGLVSSEVSGVGAGPSQELRRRLDERLRSDQEQARRAGAERVAPFTWNPVGTTAAKKTKGYGWVRYLLEQERLVLPRDPDLLRQLAGLRFEIGERGFMRIGADDPTTHDDVADALMLSAAPFKGGSRARCALAEAATSTTPDAEVRPPSETVCTGAGLVVPRRPAIQSVFGSEVTSAPEHARLSPVLERARERIEQRRS